MPKEVIRDGQFNLEIGWARDCSMVQVATVLAPPKSSESPKNLLELVQSWIPGETHDAMGLYVTLNREQINEIIRVLRKARDRAFGKDE